MEDSSSLWHANERGREGEGEGGSESERENARSIFTCPSLRELDGAVFRVPTSTTSQTSTLTISSVALYVHEMFATSICGVGR